MRCQCCNRNLSDFESTRKDKVTKAYLDLCTKCHKEIKDEKAEDFDDDDIEDLMEYD